MSVRMLGEAFRSVDSIARLAEAWDGTGRHALTGPEQRSLLELAFLPPHLSRVPWSRLHEEQRQRLIVAARKGVEFGRHCAWMFGEGRGA